MPFPLTSGRRCFPPFEFSGFDVRFSVDGDTLTVFDVAPAGSQKLK